MGIPDFSAASIQPLDALEVVRRRPEMWFGSAEGRMNHIAFGSMCLGLAEGVCGSASVVRLEIDGPSVVVTDDGIGPSLTIVPQYDAPQAQIIMTVIGACADNKARTDLAHDLCGGTGMAAINAVSERARIEIRGGGSIAFQEYRHGMPQAPFARSAIESAETGTRLEFQLDESIVDVKAIDQEVIRQRINEVTDLQAAIEITIRN